MEKLFSIKNIKITATKVLVAVLVLVVLASVLSSIISPPTFNRFAETIPSFSVYKYSSGEEYSAGGAELDVEIEELLIDWYCGSVTIVSYEGDRIKFEETGHDGGGRYTLRYLYNADRKVLDLHYCEDKIALNFIKKVKKDLTVYIPSSQISDLSLIYANGYYASVKTVGVSADTIQLFSVSGNIDADIGRSNDVTLVNVTGDILMTAVGVGNLTCNNISGNITASADVGAFTFSNVSGNTELSCEDQPISIKGTCVSGDAEFSFSENIGFAAFLETHSGKILCDFDTSLDENGMYVLGLGISSYDIRSTSGDIILKNQR